MKRDAARATREYEKRSSVACCAVQMWSGVEETELGVRGSEDLRREMKGGVKEDEKERGKEREKK